MPGQFALFGAVPCAGAVVELPESVELELESLDAPVDEELESLVCACAATAPPPIMAVLRPSITAPVLIQGFMSITSSRIRPLMRRANTGRDERSL